MSKMNKCQLCMGCMFVSKEEDLEVKYHLLITVNEFAVKETAKREGSNCWHF